MEKIFEHGIFTPKHDSTDHLWFICERCGETAKSYRTRVYKQVSAVYFWLLCEKCNLVGLRKVYLNGE